MPVKVIIFVVAATALGVAAYRDRERIKEIAEQTRDDVREFAGERIAELAELLRRVADKISPEKQEEIPMSGRAFGFSPPSSPGSPGSPPRSPTDPFANRPANPSSGSRNLFSQQQPSVVTGRDSEHADGLRLRDAAGVVPVPPTVIFDAGREEEEISLSVASSSTDSSPAVVSPPAIAPSPSVETLIAVSAHERQSESETATISFHSASSHSQSSEAEVVTPPVNPFENPQPFWNIPDWQENTTAAAIDTPSSPSLAGSAADELDNISDLAGDSGSEGSWTEVASVTSDDMINH